MTVVVYWKGKLATDRMISVDRVGKGVVGKYSNEKIRLFDEHSPYLFNGKRIRAIAVAGTIRYLDEILMEIVDVNSTVGREVQYDLLKYFKIRKEGGGKYPVTTWVLTDHLFRINWNVLRCTTYEEEKQHSTILIGEPGDTTLPFETIRWCQSAEEVAWLYCGFSQQCGFGVDVLDCETGEVTYYPYPTETTRLNIRRTLLDNLDRFFVRPIREEEVEALVYEF